MKLLKLFSGFSMQIISYRCFYFFYLNAVIVCKIIMGWRFGHSHIKNVSRVTSVCLIPQISVDAVRQLDRNLFEAYIERRADPIAGSLEPGIYASYFDWTDCQTPTGRSKISLHALVVTATPRGVRDDGWCSQPLKSDSDNPAMWKPARLFWSELWFASKVRSTGLEFCG